MTNEANAGTIRVEERKRVSLTGIRAVERFDETTICLTSALGALTIEGEALHITTLDLDRGIVEASGRIDALYYSSDEPKAPKHSLFGRISR